MWPVKHMTESARHLSGSVGQIDIFRLSRTTTPKHRATMESEANLSAAIAYIGQLKQLQAEPIVTLLEAGSTAPVPFA
jgi:hypothetical protein